MRRNLKIVVPLALALLGGGLYKVVLANPAGPDRKVSGDVYVLPKEFVINLDDGRFVKLGVGLVLEPGALSKEGLEVGVEPPEGYGPLPQEALVRDIVTDAVTRVGSRELVNRRGRRRLKNRILQAIHRDTDVRAEQVLFTDVAVQ